MNEIFNMKVNVNSCADNLKACILAYPCFFDIKIPINEKQKQNIGKVNKYKAIQQYNILVNVLQQLKVKTYFLDLNQNANYQVFTRDIGFVIDDILFVSKMGTKIRKKEIFSLKQFIQKYIPGAKTYELHNSAEGGDIFVLKDIVLIGVSERTSIEAIKEIKTVLLKYKVKKEVIPVYFEKSKLHLDCVLGIVNENTIVLSPFIDSKSIKILEPIFKNKIWIDNSTADLLGTNFLPLKNDTVLVSNKKVSDLLSNLGIKTLYIEYSEFIKAGGSIRCTVLPIYRQSTS